MKTKTTQMLLALIALSTFTFQLSTCRAAVTFSVAPAAISNTYSGQITLQVTGLTAGDTVVVQKFLDTDTNGAVSAPDLLVQQFDLTDGQPGMVIGGVTNLNVPGDTDGSADGQITATLNIPNGNFAQNLIGNYLFVLSSPVGHFTPMTKSFTITNFPYAQTISGNVNNSGTNVPGSVVLLTVPRPGHNGPGLPIGGVVTDSSGHYTIQVPPGNYVPLVLKSGYVVNFAASPVLTLGSSQTVTTNLTLTNATSNISGRMVDADNNSLGLPGLTVPISNDSGLIAVGFTDTNGVFNVPVTSGPWGISGDAAGSFSVLGYVGYNENYNVNAGDTGIVLPVHKATALFYGSVKDNLGNPLPGIEFGANDNNNIGNSTYSVNGYSDANGSYVVGVLGGLGSSDPWQVQIGSDNSHTNYIFSQQNENVDINAGQAVQQNFTAILATNHISGNVQFNGTNLAGVGISAYANINGVDYNSYVDTDNNGNYSLNVANSNVWSISVSCQGGNDSLDNILGNGNYQCPDNQNVGVTNNNGTANFTVQPCNGVQIGTTSLPDGQVNSYYDQWLSASSCNGNINWSVSSGSLPSNLTLDSDGELHGTPNSSGTFGFTVHADDGNGHSANQSLSLYIAPASSPLQITTTYLPNGTNGGFYSQTIQASGGTPPYSWSIPNYSADPPSNLTLAANGVLSGTLATSGTFYFWVRVTDAALATADSSLLQLNVVNPPPPPFVITNVSLPVGNVGVAYSAQLGATNGMPPYTWQLANGSASLPAGLSLNSSGLISGTPMTVKTNTFKVQVTDSSVYFVTTNKVLSITINPLPTISSSAFFSGNDFQMTVNGASGQNCTVLMSTNLASTNWLPLLMTNPSSGSFLFSDPHATNRARYYRVLVGPNP